MADAPFHLPSAAVGMAVATGARWLPVLDVVLALVILGLAVRLEGRS